MLLLSLLSLLSRYYYYYYHHHYYYYHYYHHCYYYDRDGEPLEHSQLDIPDSMNPANSRFGALVPWGFLQVDMPDAGISKSRHGFLEREVVRASTVVRSAVAFEEPISAGFPESSSGKRAGRALPRRRIMILIILSIILLLIMLLSIILFVLLVL